MAKKPLTKKELAFEERMIKQRAKRGYCDRDVWAIDMWFCQIISPMLKQLAKNSHGFVPLDRKGDFVHKEKLTDKETEMYAERWNKMLLHMAYLADEMNEETCSMKNPYDKEMNRIYRTFTRKYGHLGEKLQTREDLEETKKTGLIKAYLPCDDPVHGKEYGALMKKHTAYAAKIERYQNKCKDKFFELFSKYYWSLWD